MTWSRSRKNTGSDYGEGRVGVLNYLQLPVQSTCVAGVPQSCLQGMGDHMAHAGLRCLLLLGRLNLQQQGAAHGGRNQLRVHKQEHSGGKVEWRYWVDTLKSLNGHPDYITPLITKAVSRS